MLSKEEGNISINMVLSVIKRRKLAIVLSALLVTAAFTIDAYQLPERYKASTLLTVTPQVNSLNGPMPTVEDQLWTVRETVLSRPLLEKVIAEFKLYPDLPPTESALEDIRSQIDIDVVNPMAFHIGFQGGDPVVVAGVSNRLAERFVSQTASAQSRSISQANGVLEEEVESQRGKLASQIEALRARLTSQSQQIRDYKQRVGGALPERLAGNLKAIEVLEDRVQTANATIAADQATRSSTVKEMADLEKRGALDAPVVREQSASQRKIEELKLNLAEARSKYTEKNQVVTSLVKQIKELEQTPEGQPLRAEPSAVSLRYVQLSASLAGIDQRLQSERQEVNALATRLKTEVGQIDTVPQHENELASLMRDYSTTQESYQVLLARQNVAGVTDGAGRINGGLRFTIAESARPPLTPYSPRRARIILLGLLAGLGLGALIAFGSEQMNTSFLNAEEFSAFSSLPVLAEVASISKRHGGRPNAGRVVTVTQPSSVASEQYFTLAAKVWRRCQEGKYPVLLAVTSATGGEGKTLTSLNLSIALAKSFGGKVLLIDADLRRPMLHKYLGLDGTKRKGFGDLLLNPAEDFHRYILQYNGVSVLPSFRRAANPLRLLAADGTRALLERMGGEYSFVVLDSPPIVPIADGHFLSSLAGNVLLIARARRTPRELFRLAVESLDGAKVIGVVLNQVNLKHSRYASAYRYYQANYEVRKD